MQPINLARHATIAGITALGAYCIALLWQFTIVQPAVGVFYLNIFKLVFPGFYGFNAPSLLWGAVLSFIYGLLAAVLCFLIHHAFCDKHCSKGCEHM